MNLRVTNFFVASIAFCLTALFTPWWGSGIVAIAFAGMKASSARLVGFSALLGWLIAIFIRDGMCDQAPSRILVRFFQELGPEPSVLRPVLILAIAVIAAIFAGTTAGVITAVRKLWLNRR